MDDTVAKALHAIRHHLAGGGFLSDLFSGPDYLSTGEVASPTNWGDPERASDFFKADKALRLAREAQAADDVTGSIPVRAPLTAPRPGAVEERELPVNIPFAAPERDMAMPTLTGPAPLSNFQTIPGAITPMSSNFQRTAPPAPQAASFATQPIAYSPEAPAAPAAAAIDQATGKMTARVDPNSDAERANNVWNRMLIQESGGRQFDRNGNTITSPVGALGISQVMPSTGPEAARLAGLPWSLERLRTDPEYNHALGRAYYEAQLERFGDPTLAAAAYNGGPGRVAGALRQARETGQPWTAFLRPETQNYVRIVTAQPRASGGLVDDALHVVREHHADGEAVGRDEDTYGPANIEERRARIQELTTPTNYPGDKLEAPMGYMTPATAVEWKSGDAGPYAVDASGATLPLIKQPGMLPMYRDPTIDSIRPAMPGLLDLAGNIVGAPAGISAVRVARAAMAGERPMANVLESSGGKLYHGSPIKDLTELNPSSRGPLGPGTYATPDPINIAKRYAGEEGKVYQLPNQEMDIFRGAGHRTDAEYAGFKSDKQRLIDAIEPKMKDEIAPIIQKMWSGDGYPLYWSLRKAYGGDEGAQNLFKRAKFEGLSGQIDGPETLIFGKVPLKDSSASGLMRQIGPEETAANLAKFRAGNVKDVPPIVYHGTGNDIHQFDTTKGAWFTDTPSLASEYANKPGGNVVPAHIALKNPIEFVHAEQRKPIGEVISTALSGARDLSAEQISAAKPIVDVLRERYGKDARPLFEYWNNDPDITKLFKTLGYDGISAFEKADRKAKTWSIFSPEQAKSAIGNAGTFDPTKGRLNEAKGGSVEDRALMLISRQA